MIDRTFIDELASKSPTPGGGGASAYCGALASALASMVGNLTVGKKRYAAVETEIQETLQRLDTLRDNLLELIDKDAEAFEPLSRAYGLPQATPEEQAYKTLVMQQALVGATEVPLAIMGACAEVIKLTEIMAYKGSRLALSDAGAAAILAKAALEAASLNIYINAPSLEDTEQASIYLQQARELSAQAGAQADTIYAHVIAELQK